MQESNEIETEEEEEGENRKKIVNKNERIELS